MTIFRLLAAVALVLSLALPASAQDTSTDAPSGTISTEANAQTDANMAVRLREILGELGGYEDVTVTVSEGVVTLRGTTTSAAEAAGLGALVTRVEGVVAIKNNVTETADIGRRLNPAVERFTARLDQFLIFLPILAIALAVFAFIVFLGLRLARLRQPWERIAPNAFIADLFRTLVRIIFVIAGIVIALDIMNATALLSTILGAAGLIGLAIGFAVRDTVENFIASVMLSIRQPFRPNDVVEINGDQGKVIRLTSRATILLSFDGNHIRIPNATVFKSRIINFSLNRERRFQFTICVELGAELATVRNLAADTVQALPFILDEPAVSVWLGDITDSGVEVIVTGWIDQNETSLVAARGEALRLVKVAITASGVIIPDTTYTIRLDGATPPETVDFKPFAGRPAPEPTLETLVADSVDADQENALDRMIDAEREEGTGEDLLRDDALKE
jgi:small conductance mechanosensitive channel